MKDKTYCSPAAAMLACQPLSVYAATFADMNQAPWAGAKASINKAASLGLVVGETETTKTIFAPEILFLCRILPAGV